MENLEGSLQESFKNIRFNSEKFIWSQNQNKEFVIVSLDEASQDNVYSVKGLARYFLESIIEKKGPFPLVDSLAKHYSVPKAKIISDVKKFIEDLKAADIIVKNCPADELRA